MMNTALGNRRRRLKLKQAEVAKTIGITRPRLSAIENGAVIPTTQLILKLAAALDCTPNTILKDLGLLTDPAARDGRRFVSWSTARRWGST
jgi:transcriptional regulator with XRE-family HTH domain